MGSGAVMLLADFLSITLILIHLLIMIIMVVTSR